MLISRELLSAVLGLNEKFINDDINHDGDYLTWSFKGEEARPKVNIYKLQSLMKVWAWEQGFEIKSFKRIGSFKESGLYGCIVNTQDRRFFEAESHSKEEITVINTACQWILDQRNQDAN